MPEIEVRLDDHDLRAQIDPERMDRVLENFADQCRQAREIGQSLKLEGLPSQPSQIVIQGMGGSSMSGDFLKSYLDDALTIPIHLNRDYSLPNWVKPDALFIAISYSGNTEETLSCYQEARQRGCHLMGVTSGGQLEQYLNADNGLIIKLRGGMLPRTTIGYLFLPLLLLFARLGLIEKQDEQICETIELTEKLNLLYRPSSPEVDNLAKKIAVHLHDKIPLIYTCERHFGVIARRWKGQVNENAKQAAFYHVLPQMTHMELVGWGEQQDLNWQLGVVFLQDREDHPRNQLRIKLCKQVIGPRAGDMLEVDSQGDSLLARMFSLLYLGDYVSYYLALLNRVDPTPIKAIDFIKRNLGNSEHRKESL